MASNAEALNHDESENKESVEEVSDDLKAQVSSGQCVAIRGEYPPCAVLVLHHARSTDG